MPFSCLEVGNQRRIVIKLRRKNWRAESPQVERYQGRIAPSIWQESGRGVTVQVLLIGQQRCD